MLVFPYIKLNIYFHQLMGHAYLSPDKEDRYLRKIVQKSRPFGQAVVFIFGVQTAERFHMFPHILYFFNNASNAKYCILTLTSFACNHTLLHIALITTYGVF